MRLHSRQNDASARRVPQRGGALPFAPPRRDLAAAARRLDARLAGWLARSSIVSLRMTLGIVFVWFGALKFFPGLSPAQDLALRTMDVLTFGTVPPGVALVVLAIWECAIGLGLILGVAMRLTLSLLFTQMLGTFAPMFLFPGEIFGRLYSVPTLEGQYIIKNIVLISAGMTIGATVRGGAVEAEPRQRGRLRKVESLGAPNDECPAWPQQRAPFEAPPPRAARAR